MIDPHLAGRLDFVHRLPDREPLPPGVQELGLFKERDATLVVPRSVDPQRPTPLMVLFHGGGGSAQKIMPMMRDHAEREGFLLLVPQSLFPTWDIVIGGNGPDRQRLDEALAYVSSRFTLDPTRIAFAGHSDGGSYTLSLGPTNGHFVTHMIVSSAGFMSIFMQSGAPKVFISHGTRDEQIPIDRSGRVHSAKLSEAGYDVTYVEYDGPHAWQPEIAQRSVDFFLG